MIELSLRSLSSLIVENLHRFLNKSITIAVEERVANDIFVPSSID